MIANHKGEIPVVVLLLPFLLGISLGFTVFPGVGVVWLSPIFGLLLILFIALNLSYNKLKLYKQRWLGGTLVIAILFLAGWIIVINHNELNSKTHFSKTQSTQLLVKINNEPVFKNGFVRFTAKAEAGVNNQNASAVSGTLLISIKDSTARKLNYGDELLIPANYKPVEPPFNPAEFNYKRYLANQNIHYQAFLFPKQFTVNDSGKGNPLIAWSLKLRQHLVQKLKLNMRDTGAMAVASTLILGYKADLSDDIYQSYSKTGTVHVLSVSGAHVAIIYFMLTLMLGFLDKYRYGRLLKAIIVITVIWYYALLTGFSPAVCRAAVMISMVVIGKTYNRYINTLNILAISAFLLLLYNPYFIADVGFQLSYIAISGIVIFRPMVYNWLTFKNKWADKFWALCSVSIAAQIITFPLSVFYFHQFPVYFLVSNLFVVVPVTIIMYSGILYLLLPQIPVISKSVAFLLEKTILLMNKGLAVIENTPFANISKLWIGTFEYLMLYLLIISLFYFTYNKKTWLLKIGFVCVLLLSISFSFKKISFARSENIAWLNLSKHQAVIFKKGNEAVVMSDLKANDKAWQYSVQPYLDSCQVKSTTIVDLNNQVRTKWLAKQYNLVQFLNRKVLVLNQNIKNKIVDQRLKTDYLYITGNPHEGLRALNNNVAYNLMVIDGSNSDKTVEEATKQAEAAHINYKILKRNNSLISLSN